MEINAEKGSCATNQGRDERFAQALANCNGSLKYKTLTGKI